MKPNLLSAIILTYNEEIHLQRCLDSLKGVAQEIYIIDSFSTDKTKEIAERNGVHFIQNLWVNYAMQFNWGLDNCSIDTDWVILVEPHEYISEELAYNLKNKLSAMDKDIHGIRIKRLMYFFDKPLKRGGMYPIWHNKIWRKGSALCEQRWMNESVEFIQGEIATLEGDIVDYNLNGLTWWIQKHNGYATREAIDILDQKYNFTNANTVQSNLFGNGQASRRFFKIQYLKLPLFLRPFLYWFVRYFFQGGFLEGKRGLVWNLLQCGWYRILVDAKIYEAYKIAGRKKEDLIVYFKEVYDYDVTKIS